MADLIDLVYLICIIIMIIAGIAYLVLPANKLIKESKLKEGETLESAIKKMRKYGVFYLILAGLFFLTGYII